MPHSDLWQRMLAEKRGGVEAPTLTVRMQARYDEPYAMMLDNAT
ncbi:MAG: hypothetical protein ACETWR_12550 [Anaerolineae bacterium]